VNHRAVVFAGGALTADAVARLHEPERADVWCVDSGLHHAITFGLRPHTIVGDCDSVSAEALESALVQGAKLQRHPPDKAASDLELTLHAVADAGYREVDLLAVSGGRTDHALL